MKRLLSSLVLLSCLGLGCAPERTDLIIQGAVPPKVDATGCTWGAGDPKLTEAYGQINVTAQQQLNNGGLSATFGFQIANTVSSPASQTPPGSNPASPLRDDALVKALEIVATDDLGKTLASETVTATGFIPHGSSGVAIGNIVGTPLADALRQQSASFTMHLAVKAKGAFVGNGDFETGPYDFPVRVTIGQGLPASTDGGAPVIPGGTLDCE